MTAFSNHSNQWVSFADEPGIEQEINHPIATVNDNSQIWQMPTPVNLNSSGLRCSSRTEVLKRCDTVYSRQLSQIRQHACNRQAHQEVSNLPWCYSLLSVPLGMACHVWRTLYMKKFP
jgi:hypothetical protein